MNELTQDQAALLLDLIEDATEGTWPRVATALQDRGYTPAECVAATNVLAKMAHRSPILEEGDF
jgi:hypothetical protein